MRKEFEELDEASVGWTIEKWDGNDETGEKFRLIISKDGEKKVLTVIATDLGMNLDTVHPIYSKNRELHSDLYEMLYEVRDHQWHVHNIHSNSTVDTNMIETDEDVTNLLFGYRCKECGKEWWIKLSTVKWSNYNVDGVNFEHLRTAMQTPEGRKLVLNWDFVYNHDNI